jgi:hypothetical protein
MGRGCGLGGLILYTPDERKFRRVEDETSSPNLPKHSAFTEQDFGARSYQGQTSPIQPNDSRVEYERLPCAYHHDAGACTEGATMFRPKFAPGLTRRWLPALVCLTAACAGPGQKPAKPAENAQASSTAISTAADTALATYNLRELSRLIEPLSEGAERDYFAGMLAVRSGRFEMCQPDCARCPGTDAKRTVEALVCKVFGQFYLFSRSNTLQITPV